MIPGGTAMRRLILNADDYGMDEAVDRAILDLGSRGIVTAVSAMSLSPRWDEAAAALEGQNVDCGLHLDLTSPFAARVAPVTSLPWLIASAYAGRLDRSALRTAIETQLERFEAALGRRPDFVDGHQHVHQLPVIRTELLDALKRRCGADVSLIGIRICTARRWRGTKAAVIGALGGEGLARLAAERGHPVNSDFAGVYDFSPAADLAALWRGWLGSLQGGAPLAMCHVASEGDWGEDPIRSARLREFSWLGSRAFQDLCAVFAVTPARWPAPLPVRAT